LAVGLGLGSLVLTTLLLYRPAFALVVVAAIGVGTWELAAAVTKVGARPPLVPLLAGLAAMEALAWLRGPEALAVAFLLTGLAIMVWRLAEGPTRYLRDTATGVLIALYVPFLAGFAVLMAKPEGGARRGIAVMGG